MRIALLGSKNFDSLEFHINDSLNFLGHDVFHIDIKDIIKIPYRFNYWATKFFPKYDISIFSKIADKIIDYKPDLVIATYRFTHPECIKKIKAYLPKTPIVHINPDQLTTLEHQQIFASPYDFYFTKDHYMVDFMRNKMNLNAFYLPEALNPRIHKPLDIDRRLVEEKVDTDVVAFGTMYPYRANMISGLVDAGIKVNLYGTPDKRFPRKEISDNFMNEFITGERKSEILYGSKIVFNNFHFAEIQSANVKFFEIYGIGGFQICDYKETLKEYSAVDIKDFTFNTIGEAVELIQHYLPLHELRHEMAKKQMEHFHKHHTYERRMQEMLNLI
ncbi:CgeB family protein [Pedobacter sp. 22226]|uniref:CgeB family protein n=1 Tax=Pedobacter sp. 22226 TaxID=3453894 RepID=UPI003F83EAC6